MEIVITLPDGYAEILPNVQNGSVASKIILEAVKGGIVLPKHHGRLIDADKFNQTINNADYDTYNDYSNTFDWIENAPTIIKAEKEK